MTSNFNFRSVVLEATSRVNLSSENAVNQTTRTLMNVILPIVDSIINSVVAGTFNYEPFAFTVRSNSSPPITGRAGIYLIINKESRKVYLGSTVKMEARKADYKRAFYRTGTFQRSNRVYTSMESDLEQYGASSFYFVPILLFAHSQVVLNVSRGEFVNQLTSFFDLHLENGLLTHYLSIDNPRSQMFYNTVTVGRFLPGNTRGGGANSGTRRTRLALGNEVAWSDRVTWGISLKRDRQLSKIKQQSGLLRVITNNEWDNFPGAKVTEENRETFFYQPSNYPLFLSVRQRLHLTPKTGDPPNPNAPPTSSTTS